MVVSGVVVGVSALNDDLHGVGHMGGSRDGVGPSSTAVHAVDHLDGVGGSRDSHRGLRLQRRAVIYLGGIVVGDGDASLGHRQCAGDRRDAVVGGLSSRVEGVGEGVRAASDIGLATRDVGSITFTSHEAAAGDDDVVASERCSVIDFGAVATLECHVSRGDVYNIVALLYFVIWMESLYYYMHNPKI